MQGWTRTWTRDLSNITWIILVPSGLKKKNKKNKKEKKKNKKEEEREKEGMSKTKNYINLYSIQFWRAGVYLCFSWAHKPSVTWVRFVSNLPRACGGQRWVDPRYRDLAHDE